MKKIRIEKITLNIGCGGEQVKIDKAKKLLEYLTGKKPIITKSKRRSTFGVTKGKPLGVMVTLRKKDAIEFLKRSLQAVENKLKISQFDKEGNFSFGINEYIDIANAKYQHDIGILGLDVNITLERAGFRIKKRKIQRRKIPTKHNINKKDAVEWVKNSFKVEIVE